MLKLDASKRATFVKNNLLTFGVSDVIFQLMDIGCTEF